MSTVYLCGPIAGLSYEGATDWREYAAEKLKPAKALSPMRNKEFLKDVGELASCGYDKSVLSTNRGIMTRDRWDATRCDVLLVNLLDAKRVSIGSIMEIAWADLVRTPIVCAMEPGNPHEHGMVSEAIGYRVGTLDEAIAVTRSLLAV